MERFRPQYGHWPGSWESLKPEFLSQAPLDPFADGQPLRYRLLDGSPEIWSVGPNGEWDNGTLEKSTERHWNAGELDWRLIPPEEPVD